MLTMQYKTLSFAFRLESMSTALIKPRIMLQRSYLVIDL